MKKTLKLLMAITLFVAILAIATGVNAAEITNSDSVKDMTYLKDNGYLTYDNTAKAYKFQKATDADTAKIELNENTTVDLNGKVVADVLVTGTVKITDTDTANPATSGIGDVTVKGNLTADYNLGNVYLKSGSLDVTTGKTITKLVSDVSYTITKDLKGTITEFTANKNDVVLTIKDAVTSPALAKRTTTSDVDDKFVSVTDTEGNVYYVSEKAIDIATVIKNIDTGKDVNLSEVEINKDYAIRGIASYKGIELDGKSLAITVTISTANTKRATITTDGNAIVYNDSAKYDRIQFKSDFKKDGLVKLNYVYTDKSTNTVTTDKELTAVAADPTPTTTPSEAPATTAPATDDANKGDKDETPKTGDQIIPATALLAVVVVANVVYFAKSKRS